MMNSISRSDSGSDCDLEHLIRFIDATEKAETE
jgi:hypothetical protein